MIESVEWKEPDIDVINAAYAWTIADDGEVYGLVAGDHGYDATGIVIPPSHLSEYRRSVAQSEVLVKHYQECLMTAFFELDPDDPVRHVIAKALNERPQDVMDDKMVQRWNLFCAITDVHNALRSGVIVKCLNRAEAAELERLLGEIPTAHELEMPAEG